MALSWRTLANWEGKSEATSCGAVLKMSTAASTYLPREERQEDGTCCFLRTSWRCEGSQWGKARGRQAVWTHASLKSMQAPPPVDCLPTATAGMPRPAPHRLRISGSAHSTCSTEFM